MIRAYVLGKVTPNFENQVVDRIKKISGVKDVDMTFGPYDMVVSVETSDEAALKNVVVNEIRKITDITKTLTLITAKKI